MKLPNQFVNLGRQAEQPVQIVLVRLLLTVGPSLVNPSGKVVCIFSDT
jgi:hypothetical protein